MERVNAEQMAQWLAWRTSHGWSWSETARRSGHSARKLCWWQARFARSHAAEGSSPAFVAVELTDPAPSPESHATLPLEVTTPSGHRVSVPADFDAEHLRRVLQALTLSC